jgi:glucose/arabinose dehydrogenase
VGGRYSISAAALPAAPARPLVLVDTRLRILLAMLSLCLPVLLSCGAACPAQTAPAVSAQRLADVRFEPVFGGLPAFDRPLIFGAWPDGSGRLYVAEQGGRLSTFERGPQDRGQGLRLVLQLEVSRFHNEEGFLGLAFHPRFKENGKLYVHRSLKGESRGRISEFVRAADGSIDPKSERVLLEVLQPWRNHNGGQLEFGPDGYLYIGLGDGGSAGDPQENAQNLSNLLGKILRIDVDTLTPGSPYGIPADNPFVRSPAEARGEAASTPAARPEIWAFGLRNPWRFCFDSATGLLWCGDVGQDAYEEISVIHKGGNYGWRLKEGFADFSPRSQRGPGELIDPVVVYPHSLGLSVTGGYVYRGSAVPVLSGHYVYADYVTGRVWALPVAPADSPTPVAPGTRPVELQRVPQPASFGLDERGELYITSFDGRLYRAR